MNAPAGREIVLRAPGVVATVDPDAGGRLASLVVDGIERLVTAPSPVRTGTDWGCFPMAPWAGRLADATVAWRGTTRPVPPNHGRHALHGLVLSRPWTVLRAGPGACELAIDLSATGWPFGGRVRQELSLDVDRLDLAIVVEAGSEAMPAVVGWHPWFRRPAEGDIELTVRSDSVLDVDADLIPTGRLIGVDPTTDLRSGRILGDRRLDTAYIDVASPVVLGWPDLELSIAFGSQISTLVVYSPPGAVCVEPQTGWPNALGLTAAGVRGTGLTIVEPGRSFRVETTWRLARRRPIRT